MNNTDYATAYNEAYDYDTMIKVMYEYRRQKAMEMAQQKPKRKKNRWDNVFPICRNK